MPRRWAARALLLAGLAALAAGPSALGQGAGTDTVVFRDPSQGGKVVSIPAEIKESPAGVTIMAAGKAQKVIPPGDLLRVEPGGAPAAISNDVVVARGLEDGSDPAKARQLFADLAKKAGANAPEKLRRYFAFREAYWASKVADAKSGDDFAKEAKAVADRLAAVAGMAAKTWEGWPSTAIAARIHTELGDHVKAAELWSREARVPELPAPLRVEARLAEMTASLRAGQGLAVQGMIDELDKDKDVPATGPARDWLNVLRAAARVPSPPPSAKEAAKLPPDLLQKLTAAIDEAKDPVAKAVGYNFLGDAYLAGGAPHEAKWAYLWADVVYNQSPNERVYALTQLASAFERLNDKDRAEQFRAKLPQAR